MNSLKYGRYVGLQAIKKTIQVDFNITKVFIYITTTRLFFRGGVGRGGVGEGVIIIFLVFSLINSVLLWV